MAIALDSTATTSSVSGQNGNGSRVWSHTVSGDDRILLVFIHSQNTGTVANVTFDGVSMTPIRSDVSGSGTSARRETVYYMINPPTGTLNLEATFSGTITREYCTSISFTGVDQTNPINDEAGQANNLNGTISTSVTTTVPDCWIVDGMFWMGNGQDFTARGASQTPWDNNVDTGPATDFHFDSSYGGPFATPDTYAFSHDWSGGFSTAAQSVVALAPASSAVNSGFMMFF